MSNEKDQDMSKTRDIPRAEVERVRDELEKVGREYGALAEAQNRIGLHNREHYSLGREAGLREGWSMLDALLTEHAAALETLKGLQGKVSLLERELKLARGHFAWINLYKSLQTL